MQGGQGAETSSSGRAGQGRAGVSSRRPRGCAEGGGPPWWGRRAEEVASESLTDRILNAELGEQPSKGSGASGQRGEQ